MFEACQSGVLQGGVMFDEESIPGGIELGLMVACDRRALDSLFALAAGG